MELVARKILELEARCTANEKDLHGMKIVVLKHDMQAEELGEAQATNSRKVETLILLEGIVHGLRHKVKKIRARGRKYTKMVKRHRQHLLLLGKTGDYSKLIEQ